MSKAEIAYELERLQAEWKKKKESGYISEANILEQKIYLAKAYTMDPEEIQLNQDYEVEGESTLFHVEYLNGVFAWGKFAGSEEEVGVPISRLKP